MRLKRTLNVLFVVLFSITISCTKTEEKPDVVINIKISKEGYQPDVIKVERGKVVLFRITSVDEGLGEDRSQKYYGHCFYIMPPYDIMVENIGKGETKEVKVKMVYPGHHIFTCPYCSEYFPTKGDIYVN